MDKKENMTVDYSLTVPFIKVIDVLTAGLQFFAGRAMGTKEMTKTDYALTGATILAIAALATSHQFYNAYVELKPVEAEFKAAQMQINGYVKETGQGQWSCLEKGQKVTYDGQVVKRDEPLRQLIDKGIKEGTCRASLTVKPSLSTPAPL
ncbi:MAG: hypothetical protein WC612_04665 [Bdellovibrionales bacterium]